MKRRTFILALPPTLLGLHGLAHAQAFPNKPIRYIVPVAAGGGSDMVGRTVTERWGKLLNQTFVVDNQGGGGGVIASQNTAARARRRLHADAGLRRDARHQPGHAQAALRRGQGLHARSA